MSSVKHNRWRSLPITSDENLLYVGGKPVVGFGEKALQSFFVACCGIRPCDSVYEIGYGLGYASCAIDSRNPRSHVIIEANAELAKRASANHGRAKVINALWEEYFEKPLDWPGIIVYDGMPPHRTYKSDRELATSHLEPVLTQLVPVLPKGSVVAALDPSGALTAEDIVGMANNKRIEITAVPPHCIPSGLPWFINGCGIVRVLI